MPSAVTLAIPFYRGHDYLRRAIDSVLRQTSPDWRLVVSDDGGPEDGTADLVRRYADPRIRYARNPANLGMAGNWNRCLDLADTDLVCLLHADDELLPDYVERVCAAADRDPTAAAVFTGARIIGPDGRAAFSLADAVKRFLWPHRRRASVVAGRRAVEAIGLGNFLMCPTACYRRAVLGGRRFSGRWRFVLDVEFFADLLLAGEHFVLLPEHLYAYRRHPENATEVYSASAVRFAEEASFYDHLAVRAARKGWRTAATRARVRPLVRLHAAHRVVQSLLGGHLRQAGRQFGRVFG